MRPFESLRGACGDRDVRAPCVRCPRGARRWVVHRNWLLAVMLLQFVGVLAPLTFSLGYVAGFVLSAVLLFATFFATGDLVMVTASGVTVWRVEMGVLRRCEFLEGRVTLERGGPWEDLEGDGVQLYLRSGEHHVLLEPLSEVADALEEKLRCALEIQPVGPPPHARRPYR